MKIPRFLRALFLAATLLAGPAAAQEVDLVPATAAADEWLRMVDTGRYPESWESSAPSFQQAVDKRQWEVSMQSARAPLGVVLSRKVRSALYTKTLPGAPDGEYVVIQYDTRFENRPLSIETVTPMRGKDGTWRVSGYYIR
jgi:uncharacterized protein DUF4019